MFRTLRRLLSFALPFWRGILLSVVLSVFTIGSSIGLMATSAWLISKAGLQPSIAELGVAPVMVRFFGISRGVFRYLERLISHGITFRLLARLRVWFYEHLEPLAPARLLQYRSGDLLSRVVSDIETLENVYVRVIAPPLVALIVGGLVALFFSAFDPFVALTLVALISITGTMLPVLAWWTGQRPGRKLIAARAEMNAALVDSIQGLADSLVYGYTEKQLHELDRLNEQLAHQEGRIAGWESIQLTLSVLMVNLSALVILIIAIPRVDPIFLATLTLTVIATYEAITPLATAAQHLGSSIAAAERLFEIVDTKPAVTEPAHPIPLPASPTLTVENLSFSYAPDLPPAQENIHLHVEPGQRVAIVGTSGAGKSTLVNLLVRFYDAQVGTIQLGGENIRHFSLEDLRRTFGVMSQQTTLFNTTIRENIRIGRVDATDDELIEAAKQAQIHEVIERLPAGYMTGIGEGGAKLSGGERQRMALARLLLRDAPIFVLDEATAHLDAMTERDILRNILKVTKGRTVLIITHRLTLLEEMDNIIVLEQGKIIEQGSHKALLEKQGAYYRLHQSRPVSS